MTDSALQTGDASASPTIEGLMAKLSDTSLPEYGRQPLIDQLTALHKAKADAGGGSQTQDVDDATAEAFAPPASALAYQFEQALPPGVVIGDDAALGTLKGSLADAGVPADLANGAFAHVAMLHAEGAFDTPRFRRERGAQLSRHARQGSWPGSGRADRRRCNRMDERPRAAAPDAARGAAPRPSLADGCHGRRQHAPRRRGLITLKEKPHVRSIRRRPSLRCRL